MYKAWRKARAAAGLPTTSSRMTSATCRTRSAQIPGVTVKDLLARMGHKSEQAALRYLHASAEADATVAQGLDAAFRRVRDADNDDPERASNDTEPDADGPADTATDAGQSVGCSAAVLVV